MIDSFYKRVSIIGNYQTNYAFKAPAICSYTVYFETKFKRIQIINQFKRIYIINKNYV